MSHRLRIQATPGYGDIATVHETPAELSTLLEEVEEYFACGATLSPGDTVIDAGANIGAFAVAAGKRCGGRVRMLCFEPVPPLFEALKANLRDSEHLKGGAHRAFDVALSTPADAGTPCEFFYFTRFPRDSTMDISAKRREFRAFFAHHGKRIADKVRFLGPGARLLEHGIAALPRGGVGEWLSDQATGLEVLSVQRTTLSQAIADLDVGRIALLKVDVEGAEGQVLEGTNASLWKRIDQVAVECDGAEATVSALRETLRANGGFESVHVFEPPSMKDRGLKNVLLYAKRG